MSFFGNLFKKNPRVELHDPVFGRLTFSEGIWGFVPKTPGAEFMVTVAAPETGPTDSQRDFFQRIRSGLSEFEHLAKTFLRSRAAESVDVRQLSVYSIEIGDDAETGRQQFVLELSDAAADAIHRVVFRAGEPVDCGFDD